MPVIFTQCDPAVMENVVAQLAVISTVKEFGTAEPISEQQH
jgi:hypothetical protein